MKIAMIIYALMFFSVVASADKESAQSRADDCFTELNGMVDATNEANFNGSGLGGTANRKFRIKKDQCLSAKLAYEKSYGKYKKTKEAPTQPTRIVFEHPSDKKKEKMAIAFLKQAFQTKREMGVVEIQGLMCTRQPLDSNVLDGLTSMYKRLSGGKNIDDISCEEIDAQRSQSSN